MYNHILVPVVMDPAHPASESFQVAEKLLAEGGRVSLLHVMEEIPAYVTARIPKEVLEEGRAGISAQLKSMAAEISGPVETHVIQGQPGQSIVDFAEARGADCIIVRSHKPELADYLLGSTAARVVRHATCSVHVIR